MAITKLIDLNGLSTFYTHIKTKISAKYSLPSGGIPKTDLASAVQTSLDKADGALQKSQGSSNAGKIIVVGSDGIAAPGNLVIAPDFSASTAYAAGDYVFYNNQLYKFTSAHAAGAWTGTDAVAVSYALEDDVNEIARLTIKEIATGETETIPISATFTEGYVDASGNVTSSSSYHYTQKLPAAKGDIFATSGINIRFVTAFSGNTVIPASGQSSATASYTVPDGIDGVILSLKAAATTINKTTSVKVYENIYNDDITAIDSALDLEEIHEYSSQNRFDVSTVTENAVLNSSGVGTSSSDTYNTSDYIYVGDLTSLKIYRNETPVLYVAYYVLYNADHENIGTRGTGSTIDVTSATFVRFSYQTPQQYTQAADGSATVSFYEAYLAPTVYNGSKELNTIGADIEALCASNVLYGKKWVSCGDSFTAGGYLTSDVADISEKFITSGKYKGENKVYPFIIGNRNNMTIVNEAVGGSTMCYIDGTHSEFSTANGRYTQIPSDADYITLYFGINDVNYSSPLGTITDDVNTTFYGAWNVVLAYLIEHHPYAKIGIIVTNGASQTIREAEIAIAKRWGLAYYDMNGLPLMHRSFNQDVLTSVKTERNENFRISSTNLHPNGKAHEYQSTCIEAWLRTI